jgi:hypothetical protein
VAVLIESNPEIAKEYGKHFDAEHDVCSRVSVSVFLFLYFLFFIIYYYLYFNFFE